MLLAMINTTAAIADDDTRLRLQQGIERSASEREQQLLQEEDTEKPLPGLLIDGKPYEVQHNHSDLGRALYLALTHHHWQAASQYLRAYLTLDNPEPELVHFAQGKLARVQGNHEQAEQEFRTLLAIRPSFMLGKLELARTLFENHKNRESEKLFRDILAEAEQHPEPEKTFGVRRTLHNFIAALEQRRSWQGRLAIGPGYSDNINQSSESDDCLIWLPNHQCYVRRTVPKAVGAESLTYELSLEKSHFLEGNHNLFLRSLAYGYSYHDNSDYNQSTYRLDAGYRFRSASLSWALSPLLEYVSQGNDGLYRAWGGHVEAMSYFSPRSAFRAEVDYKTLDYTNLKHFNGHQVSVFTTWWHTLNARWTIFGGVDVSTRNTRDSATSSNQFGARLGASRVLAPGIDLTLFSSFREQRYKAFSALLGAQREDFRQHYMASLRMPRFSVSGFYPSLTLEHSRVSSNVEWLYRYQENRFVLKLERQF